MTVWKPKRVDLRFNQGRFQQETKTRQVSLILRRYSGGSPPQEREIMKSLQNAKKPVAVKRPQEDDLSHKKVRMASCSTYGEGGDIGYGVDSRRKNLMGLRVTLRKKICNRKKSVTGTKE